MSNTPVTITFTFHLCWIIWLADFGECSTIKKLFCRNSEAFTTKLI